MVRGNRTLSNFKTRSTTANIVRAETIKQRASGSQNNKKMAQENIEMESASRINGLALLTANYEGNKDETKFFFRQFDEVALLAKWKDSEKLTILKSKLRGNALRYLMSDRELMNSQNYDLVRDKIMDFFRDELDVGQCQLDFSNCHMRENESVKMFAHRLVVASNKYLGTSQTEISQDTKAVIDKLRLSKFVGALLPEIQRDVLKLNPKSFEQAIEIAKNSQMALDTVARCKINALKVENSFSQSEEQQLQQINRMETTTQNPPGQVQAMQCYLCGVSGDHFSTECEAFKSMINIPQQNRHNQQYPNTQNARGGYSGQRGGNRGNISQNRYFRNPNQHVRGQNRQNRGNYYYNNQSRGRYNSHGNNNSQASNHFLDIAQGDMENT